MGNTMGEIRKSQMHLTSNVEETKKEVKELKLVNEQLQSKITDLQARSMRDNLLFFGLAEYRGRGRENCASLVSDFCETELNITGISEKIERAHHIGKFNSNKTRPIVVKFTSFKERERVRLSAHKTRNRGFAIREQFPREIVEKRKSLLPIMKRALDNKKRAVLKVDKLYIDGTLYEGKAEADSEDEDDTGETGTQIMGDDEEET
uniref:Uncharacterized protein LOC111106652 n=1 Tax=Crassostrea virginica TaxID=6565 RepID=A0A8B8B129_CRAVI|nr:uncharacterized protein LOC111106652 [Crassostrea virginica]